LYKREQAGKSVKAQSQKSPVPLSEKFTILRLQKSLKKVKKLEINTRAGTNDANESIYDGASVQKSHLQLKDMSRQKTAPRCWYAVPLDAHPATGQSPTSHPTL